MIVAGQLLEPVFEKMKTGLHIREESGWWHAFQSLRTLTLWMFGMLFFRAVSLPDALMRLGDSLHVQLGSGVLFSIRSAIDFSALGGTGGLAVMGLSFLAVLVVDYLKYRNIDVQEKLAGLKWPYRWALYYVLVVVLFCSLDIAAQESIYAQF